MSWVIIRDHAYTDNTSDIVDDFQDFYMCFSGYRSGRG